MGIGAGDLNIKAECRLLIQTCSIEDNHYYNSAEVTRTTTNGSTIYDNNMSIVLPSKCEISFDIQASNVNVSSERRYFILPKSQYSSGTSQPLYALFIQFGSSVLECGKRENGALSVFTGGTHSASNNTYYNVKFIRDNDSIKVYIDDVLWKTGNASFLDNYSDWTLSMIRWSATGTSKIKNVKIKSL